MRIPMTFSPSNHPVLIIWSSFLQPQIVASDVTLASFIFSFNTLFLLYEPFYRTIDKEYQVLSTSYAKKQSMHTGVEEGEEELFFIRLDYSSSQGLFNKYRLSTVPVMIHIGPDYGSEASEDSSSSKSSNYEILPKSTYQVPKVPSAEHIEGFIRERTAINIPIYRSMIGTYILLFFVFLVLAILATIAVNHLEFWLRVIRVKMLWVVISLV